MEDSAIWIGGACLALIAMAWDSWPKHQALENERLQMLKLYDAVVAFEDATAPERLLRIRALRVLVTSLAGGELRLGLLAALDLQEAELPKADATIESAIEVLLETRVERIAKRELVTHSTGIYLPDTPWLISRFVRDVIRDWRALSGSQPSTTDADLRRHVQDMAQLEHQLRAEAGTPRFPQTPQLISRMVRELLRERRALKSFR